MAVKKPVGDNARKGAVKKRTQLKTTCGVTAWTKRSKTSGIHGGEKARREEKGRQKVQGGAAGEVTRAARRAKAH
jgi:hypothetical protein